MIIRREKIKLLLCAKNIANYKIQLQQNNQMFDLFLEIV